MSPRNIHIGGPHNKYLTFSPVVPGAVDDKGSWLLALLLVFTRSGVLTDAGDEAASF